jgi:radical SAM superfamily enzyme YgiQ (UPF0313 family)
MIGSPGETAETIRKTIDFAKKLCVDYAQFSITTPFPGTELFGFLPDEGKDIPWESFIYEGKNTSLIPPFKGSQLSQEDLKQWGKRAYREFYVRPRYIWQRIRRLTNPGEMKVTIKGLLMLLRNILPSRNR